MARASLGELSKKNPNGEGIFIYGKEGVGKTTVASILFKKQGGRTLFFVSENGLASLTNTGLGENVDVFSTQEGVPVKFDTINKLISGLDHFKSNYAKEYADIKTIVIDSIAPIIEGEEHHYAKMEQDKVNEADKKLAITKAVDNLNMSFAGFESVKNNLKRVIDFIDEILAMGINVVITCHAQDNDEALVTSTVAGRTKVISPRLRKMKNYDYASALTYSLSTIMYVARDTDLKDIEGMRNKQSKVAASSNAFVVGNDALVAKNRVGYNGGPINFGIGENPYDMMVERAKGGA